MLKESHSLPLRTLAGHYLIQETIYLGKDTICYRAEDMRLNRQVLLKEYYPSDIAKRHMKQDDTYMVDVDPSQHDIFIASKKQIMNTYATLKGFNHDAIVSCYGFFEANGTIYTAFDYIDTKTVQLNLEQRIKYSENEIGVFAKSLVLALTALQYRGLSVHHIQSDMIYIDKKRNAVLSGLIDFIPLESSSYEHVIYDIGVLMYVMLKGTPLKANKKVEKLISDDNYSTVICELINSMLSPELSNRPKRLQEIQTLLSSYSTDESLYEPVLSGTNSRPFSFLAKLKSIAIILFFSIYLLFYQPKELKIEDISMLETVQFHLAAYFGNAEAQRALGQIYERGHNTEPNVLKALQWYEKAASQGYLDAQMSLGHIYKNGIGIEKDDKQAAHWFYEAAKQGDSVAQYNTAYFYYNGTGVTKNKKEAQKWFEKAAEQNYENAAYMAGKIYYEGDGLEKDYKKSLFWFQKSAAMGDVNAEIAIGDLYKLGEGVKQDDKKAFQWYMKAAQKGDKRAQYNLANAYQYGYGTTINHNDAIFWYQKASAQNDLLANNELKKLKNKIDEQKRIEESKRLKNEIENKKRIEESKRLVESKKSPSKTNLSKGKPLPSFRSTFLPHEDDNKEYITGYMYEKKKDDKQALKWYLKAAEQGDHRAQYKAGWLYQWGKNMNRDHVEAMYWYKLAAEQKNVYAYYQISYLYTADKGIIKDEHLAFQWCKKAAKHGLTIAQKILGFHYESGKGTEIDYHKAIYWYQKAAAQGNNDARNSIISLKKRL